MQNIWLVVVVAAVVVTVTPAYARDVQVDTTYGPVVGYTKEGAAVWRGIPFAAPPVGKLRFASPVPPEKWTTPRPAKENGHICPQAASVAGIVVGHEDCLYLNVYAPEDADPNSKLPVMVWIFGGGWVVGDLEESLPPPEEGNGLYDGKHLATTHNVVIVAMNYRLSALGFMALDALRDPQSANSTGNYALQDQRAALHWVQDNIVGFGGDPDKVLLFGESAGAFSTCWHLGSPASRGLFRAAILESGTCDSPLFFRAWPRAQKWSEEYAAKVGCPGGDSAQVAACLRSLPVDKLLGAGEFLAGDRADGRIAFEPLLAPVMPWGAAIDGSPLGQTETPYQAIKAGRFSHVPTIMGSNNNAGSIFIPMIAAIAKIDLPLNQGTATKVLERFFNASTVADIWTRYPVSAYKNSYDYAASMVLRDYFFECAEQRAMRSMAAQGVPVWSYRFSYKDDDPLFPIFGDAHASELRFVWGNPFYLPWSDRDAQVSATFGAYWTSLAKNLVPSGPVEWPGFNATSPVNLIIADPVVVEDGYDRAVCPFWDRVEVDYGYP